jgi:hypothetical protein
MVNSVIAESSSLISESKKNVIRHTFSCSRYDLEDACDRALVLISEMGSKNAAIGHIQEEIDAIGTEEEMDYENPKYWRLKLIAAVVKVIDF